jgi:FAD/FMN-containing dehydrogenase
MIDGKFFQFTVVAAIPAQWWHLMKLSRRTFIQSTGLAALGSATGCLVPSTSLTPVQVNDVHTQLNPTQVRGISPVRSLDDIQQVIRRARREHRPVSIAGGRHAAGGQQFATDAELLDTRELRRVLQFDADAGTIDLESGIQWPDVMAYLSAARNGARKTWSVAQRQTGTDRLSLGGALAANAHGRGLQLPPFISCVDSFVLVDARGRCVTCSRQQNSDLFQLVIGGYGLFGFVYSVRLRLAPLRKVRRVVAMLDMVEVPAMFAERIRSGFLFGDCQFAIDSRSPDFLRRSIMTCYEPVADDVPVPAQSSKLSEQDWKTLIYLAHVDPARAYEIYTQRYLATSGEVYWSDTQYVSDYFENYHWDLDVKLNPPQPGSEALMEFYVPRDALPEFFRAAAEELRRSAVPLIYGNVRLIEKDTESFLVWAKRQYACVVFNLHTPHTTEGIERTTNTFRALTDLAIRQDGSYYLTYHRFPTREQVLTCYPQFPEFLRLKSHHDPGALFQSDWYRFYRKMFASS